MQGQSGRLQVLAGGRRFGLLSSDVAEIIRVPVCTRVPHAPASLVGLANLRGIVLPVVCLAVLLGESPADGNGRSRVVVLAGAPPIGLLVEDVLSLAAGGDGDCLDPRALLARDFGGGRRRVTTDGDRGAAAAPAPEAPRDRVALIGLQVGGRDFAMRLQEVAGIVRLPKGFGAVPRADDAMLGVTGFRGAVLPLVSLAVLLGLERALPARGVVIVVRAGAGWAGLVADGVSGSFMLAADAIDAVPRLLARGAGEALLEGICRLENGNLVGLLARAHLFDRETQKLLEESGSQAICAARPEAMAAPAQFVLFEIGDMLYGLPIAAVDEVVRRPEKLAGAPAMPDFLLGVLSLRGRTVPVIDLAERFGRGAGRSAGGRVIVVSDGGRQAGLAVESVQAVLAIDPSALQPAPAFTGETEALFDRVALTHQGRMVLLVSPAFVLAQAERELTFSSRARAGQVRMPS